jgi:hypothetical protein
MIPFKVHFHRVGEPYSFDLVSGKDFNLDLSMFSKLLSGSLAPAFSDFLRIAESVYVADRLLRRRCKCHPGKWDFGNTPKTITDGMGGIDPDE